jgi:hypothetical protein
VLADWGFDEGTGQLVRDAGPFGLDGRLGATGGADPADPVRIPGAVGGALRFDGSSFVTLPGTSRLEPQTLTVDAVVRAPHSPGAYRYILSGGGDGCWSGSYGLYTAPAGGVALYVYDGRRYVLSATARPDDVWDGAWHSIRGTFDGRALRLYVDGHPVGAPMTANATIDYGLPSRGTTIGAYAGACDLGFVGDVDSVQLRAGAASSDKPSSALGPEAPGGAQPPTTFDRPPLPPAAPGMTLPAEPRPASTPPTRSRCSVRLSRSRIAPGRRAVLRVRVAGASKAKVTVRRGRRTVATTRVKASRSTRLLLRAQRVGTLTFKTAGCTSTTLSIRH